ncbi:MAG: heavy-metal-associated domain-containing protein, partial [Muribaculaceae bacterium]|nr:heavy-metal-associated domain-containing protein [Muribaculaceae bacterium]
MAKTLKTIYPVAGMGCAACAARIEKTLSSAPGVEAAVVNFANSTVSVSFDQGLTSPEALRKAVVDAGYDLIIEEGKV